MKYKWKHWINCLGLEFIRSLFLVLEINADDLQYFKKPNKITRIKNRSAIKN